MANSSTVTLSVGAAGATSQITVWDEYKITLSMFSAGNPWTFLFWRHHDTQSDLSGYSTWDQVNAIRVGDIAELAIDGQVILSGVVETRQITADHPQGAHMVISGRDYAAPALEGHADPTISLRGVALGDAVARLLAGVGLGNVQVSATAAAVAAGALRQPRRNRTGKVSRNALLDLVKPRVGETVWSVIQRICHKAGFLCWVGPGPDAHTMALVIDVPGYTGATAYTFTRIETAPGVVTPSSNILSGGEKTSLHDVPTEVIVSGDAIRGDSTAARNRSVVLNDGLATTQNALRISEVLLPSPRYIKSDHARSPNDATQEARALIAERNAHLRECEYIVQGHAQGGSVYALNQMSTVRDDTCGVNENMLVHALTFQGSKAHGQTTTVTLSPVGQIVMVPQN